MFIDHTAPENVLSDNEQAKKLKKSVSSSEGQGEMLTQYTDFIVSVNPQEPEQNNQTPTSKSTKSCCTVM